MDFPVLALKLDIHIERYLYSTRSSWRPCAISSIVKVEKEFRLSNIERNFLGIFPRKCFQRDQRKCWISEYSLRIRVMLWCFDHFLFSDLECFNTQVQEWRIINTLLRHYAISLSRCWGFLFSYAKGKWEPKIFAGSSADG